MTLARCRVCRGVLSADEPTCPHCGATRPVDPSRRENWVTDRDPMRLEPDSKGPFRFLVKVGLVFVALAILLAWCATTA